MSQGSRIGDSSSTFRFFGERGASSALVFLAALPVAYLCVLPWLAGKQVQFAHRCPGFPRCHGSLTGLLIVGDLLANPQATGAFAAVFFWPLFHLWSLKATISSIVGNTMGLALLLVFYLGFGWSMIVPVTISVSVHALATIAYSVSALSIFTLLLWHFRSRDLLYFKIMLVISAACSLASVIVNGVGCLTHLQGRDMIHVASPWYLYVLEACGLSCLSLLPWFWARDVVREGDDGSPRGGSLMRTLDTFAVVDNSFSRCILFFLAAMPVAYVWCLPLLANLGFARLCKHCPRCADSVIGASVSNFIATPQATGAMASAFFWPMAHMWSHKGEMGGLGNFTLLIAFYLFFGLFLACPVTKYPQAHALVVAAFCLCGLLYFRGMLLICREPDLQSCRVLLIVSMAAFSGVIVLNIVSLVGSLFGDRVIIRETVPWLFYACEATGLSSMSLFPWRWHVRHESLGS